MTSQAENQTMTTPSTSSTSTLPRQDKLSLSELFKFISPFDGNRDELASFLANCDAAFEIAHDSQLGILLRFVITQIQGKAKAAICNRDFKDWRELSDFLKLLYHDRKHYAQLLCELTNIQQKQNENIHQFIERVETLLKRVTTAIKQN